MAASSERSKCLVTLQKLVRLRAADDAGYCNCVSCGVVQYWNSGMQGGHFISKGKGGANQWALDERNVNPQCSGCNGYGMKYGNAETNYACFMIDKYGRDLVDQMRLQNNVVKLSEIELKDMNKRWKIEIKKHLERIGKK